MSVVVKRHSVLWRQLISGTRSSSDYLHIALSFLDTNYEYFGLNILKQFTDDLLFHVKESQGAENILSMYYFTEKFIQALQPEKKLSSGGLRLKLLNNENSEKSEALNSIAESCDRIDKWKAFVLQVIGDKDALKIIKNFSDVVSSTNLYLAPLINSHLFYCEKLFDRLQLNDDWDD